jgi:general secretion pathway protein G
MNMKDIKSKKTGRRAFRQRAFTLVELLLVLTILAILAGIVLPKLAGRSEDAKKKAAIAEIASMKTALSMFEVDNGYFPKGQNGLRDLMVRPANAPNWKGPYLERDTPVINDPWGKPYVYQFPGRHNPNGYDLSSLGPNGAGGNEAIGNWTAQGTQTSQ